MEYCKRLIEVDLPIKEISKQSQREKSIRHGNISTLHVWWARRPLASCRSVLLATILPDPLDIKCPSEFILEATKLMNGFYDKLEQSTKEEHNRVYLRDILLKFIADFSSWNNSIDKEYLTLSRKLVNLSHRTLSDHRDLHPLVVDPFSGGGSIPLEALRIGADAYASDLNPLAVLLTKVMLEYLPQSRKDISKLIERYGYWIKSNAEKELADMYPKYSDDSVPVGYLWARTICCEGPGCGAELPLIGQTLLSGKENNKYAFGLEIDKHKKEVKIRILKNPKETEIMEAISQKSSATCPVCGYTTPAKNVRKQLSEKHGGSADSRLLGVITVNSARKGRSYRPPNDNDYISLQTAKERLAKADLERINNLPLIPHEFCPPHGALGYRFQNYGIIRWRDLYTPRQLIALSTLVKLLNSSELRDLIDKECCNESEKKAILICLAFAIGRVNDLSSTLCRWLPSLEAVAASNGGQNKMPMILDYVEANPIGGAGGDFMGQINWIVRVVNYIAASDIQSGTVQIGPAQKTALPDNSASILFTDPPYYDAFGYSDLSEFFYPWIRRALGEDILGYSRDNVPKREEIIVVNKNLPDDRGEKSDASYQREMTLALDTYRRVIHPDGVGVIVFANKTTSGWEALLQSIIDAGWFITASWPILTERPVRQRAIGSAALQSSVHLVVRPRETIEGVLTEEIADWRDVISQLPIKIHEWMPRLRKEGIVGADAIFACLGPALEVFSRYSKVEKAGEPVSLKEYLEHVWAAVSKEGLNMVFEGADPQGLEEDARLTAMWLWTLSTGTNEREGNKVVKEEPEEEYGADEESKKKPAGYILEYDAARKISQGLGVNLEDIAKSGGIVEIKGSTARLLSVGERQKFLFGKKEMPKESKRKDQLTLFGGRVKEDEGEYFEKGTTALDRLHQAMLMFSMNRNDALKRFLIDDGVGSDEKFWKLADALNALYPAGSEEQRWIQGLLAKKKGMGF